MSFLIFKGIAFGTYLDLDVRQVIPVDGMHRWINKVRHPLSNPFSR